MVCLILKKLLLRSYVNKLLSFNDSAGDDQDQRQGPREHIYLIILIIPVVAFVIDRLLFMIQKGLFPHKYGGNGWALYLARMVAHGIDDAKGLFFRTTDETGPRS